MSTTLNKQNKYEIIKDGTNKDTINKITLYIHSDMNENRKNIICESNKFAQFVENYNTVHDTITSIKKTFDDLDDIKLIGINRFH
jgi:hypothetical protein